MAQRWTSGVKGYCGTGYATSASYFTFLSYKCDSISNLYIVRRPGKEETKAEPDPNLKFACHSSSIKHTR